MVNVRDGLLLMKLMACCLLCLMSAMGFHCEGCKTYEMAKVFTGYSCFVLLA